MGVSVRKLECICDTVIVLKFRTLVACQKCPDEHCRARSDCFFRRSSLIRVFSVCHPDKNFVNSSPENKYNLFENKQKKKTVRNFRVNFNVNANITS